MSELSDTAWETLTAAIDGEPAAEPSPAEPDAPEADAQTVTDQTAPDGVEEPAAVEPDADPEPDAKAAELAAREAALAERERAEAQAKAEAQARYLAWQEQEAEKKSNAYYQELEQVDPDLAKQYLGFRQGVLQQRREAEARANGAEHGLTAAMIALEQVVGPEQFQQVLELTGHLVSYQSADQMQNALMQEKRRAAEQSAEKAALQNTIRELRAQIEAKNRPAEADAVDRGAAGPGSGTRLQDAPDFGTFFEQLIQGAA